MNNAMTINTALAELRVFARDEINATAISVGCLRAVAHQTLKEIQNSDDYVSVRTVDAGIPGFSFSASRRTARRADLGRPSRRRRTAPCADHAAAGRDVVHRLGAPPPGPHCVCAWGRQERDPPSVLWGPSAAAERHCSPPWNRIRGAQRAVRGRSAGSLSSRRRPDLRR